MPLRLNTKRALEGQISLHLGKALEQNFNILVLRDGRMRVDMNPLQMPEPRDYEKENFGSSIPHHETWSDNYVKRLEFFIILIIQFFGEN